MRINQLREEGATENIDLTPTLKDYYDRHMADGTFVSWLAFDNEKKDVKDKDGLYTLSNIPEGKHSISLKKVGFKTINKDFEMSKDEGIELGSFDLQITDFKRLEIEVSPLDVEVFIDGEKVNTERKGNSLKTDYLEPKTVTIEIRAKGFKPYKNEKFEIYSDISNFMGPITLEKRKIKRNDV